MRETAGSTEALGASHPAHGFEVDEVHAQLEKLVVPPAMLERLFAYAPVGFQLYEASGHSLLTNRAFLEMFGSIPPPDYNVLEDEIAEREGVLGLIRRAFAGEVVRVPPVWYDPRELKKVRVPSGRRVAIDSTFFPVFDRDGRVTHVGVVFKDVSAELIAQQEAEAERDLLRALVAQSGDGILVVDEQGALRLFNPEAARQHGRSLENLSLVKWAEVFQLETEEGQHLPLERSPLWRALQGEAVASAFWRVRRPDGSRRLLSGTATPLRRVDGALYGAMIITRDETERRLAAEERRIAQFKDRMIGILGHDLRTPLTAIRASAALLAKEDGASEAELRAMVKRLTGVIDRSAERMSRMIGDVLDFTRARIGGGIQIVRRRTDLGAVTLGVVEELRAIDPAREIRFESRGSLVGEWDADRLAQVVQNLVGNALSHGDPAAPVTVTIDGSDAEVRLTVRNEGAPIPPETLVRLFDPFRRGADARRGRYEGLGLGLFIVRSLVEAHGGHVQARSNAPSGTTLTVLLPRK